MDIHLPIPAVDPSQEPYLTVEDVAAVCHEANRRYCVSIGDTSQVSWADAEEWQRASAIAGVRLHQKTRDAGQTLSPDACHNAWMAHKVADGWTYGPVKDPSIKQHPCMVPFDQLPKKDQVKDELFSQICATLLPLTMSEDLFAIDPA